MPLSVVSERISAVFIFWDWDIHKQSDTSGSWRQFAREDFPKLSSSPASQLTPLLCIFLEFSL